MFMAAANLMMSTLLQPMSSVPNACLLFTSKLKPPLSVGYSGDVMNKCWTSQPRHLMVKVEQKPRRLLYSSSSARLFPPQERQRRAKVKACKRTGRLISL